MIVVSGASRGIGYEVARRLHERGQSVVGLSRGGRSDADFPVDKLDIRDDVAVSRYARRLRQHGIRVDALINAAGIASMNLALMTPIGVTSDLLQTNFLGTVSACKHFSPLLIRAGGGVIINFSTIAVSLHLEGESSYVASKAAVEAYSRVLARELAKHQVRVNCIAPGPIETALLRGVSANQVSRIVDRQLLKHQFKCSDVADLVEILLDNRAASLTGHVFHLGGV